LTLVTLGNLTAILGLALLVLGSGGRRRHRRIRSGDTGLFKGIYWVDGVAYVLILAGLLTMWVQK